MCPLAVGDIGNIFNYITCLISQSLIPLVFALAGAMFVWGVVKYFIIDAGEEAKRAQGKQFILWGLIALAVISSVWGLIRLLAGPIFYPYTTVFPGVTPPGFSPNTNPGGPGGGGSGGGGGGGSGPHPNLCPPGSISIFPPCKPNPLP